MIAHRISRFIRAHEVVCRCVTVLCAAALLVPGALMLAACDSTETPAQPSTQAGQPTSVLVTLPAVIYMGVGAQASVVVSLDNGTTKAAADSWSSENTAVATVSSTGFVQGVSSGTASIVATAGTRTGRTSVRVVPSYNGVWTGTYAVTSCTPFPTAAYTHHCTGVGPGTTGTFAMTMVQTEGGVTGQLVMDGVSGTSFVAVPAADGGIIAQSTNLVPPYSNETTWWVNSTQPGQATGTLRWVRRGASGLIGGAEIAGTITSMRKQ